MVTVVLAEDHKIVREGFRALLEEETDISVVGETGDGGEVSQLIEETAPDILVLDLTIPGVHGLEVTRQVSYKNPDTEIVILSMHNQKAYVTAAFNNGAVGYVLKDDTGEHLTQAIRQVLAGDRFVSPSLPFTLSEIQEILKDNSSGQASKPLSPREQEVLRLVAKGDTSAMIADALHISRRTVERHRQNIMSKCGVDNARQLVRYAVEHGLVPRIDS